MSNIGPLLEAPLTYRLHCDGTRLWAAGASWAGLPVPLAGGTALFWGLLDGTDVKNHMYAQASQNTMEAVLALSET